MSKIRTDRVAITAAAQPITALPLETSFYAFKAPTSNGSTVYIGTSGVTTGNGYALEPGDELTYRARVESGEQNFDVPITDWYVIGTNGDVLTWLAHLS